MNILITGAKGFVGQNPATALMEIQNGHDRREDPVLCAAPAEFTLYYYDLNNTATELLDMEAHQ